MVINLETLHLFHKSGTPRAVRFILGTDKILIGAVKYFATFGMLLFINLFKDVVTLESA